MIKLEAGNEMQLIVRYEDPYLLAVEKPPGAHTAPLRAGEGGTLLDAVIARYPEVARLPGIKAIEPGLLHRLDRDTSGLVLVARTPESFATLRASFDAVAVEKGYLAVCRRVAPEALPADHARAGLLRTPRQLPGGRLRIESRFAPFGPGRRRVRLVDALVGGEAAGAGPPSGSLLPAGPIGQLGARGGPRRPPAETTNRRYATEVELLEERGGLILVRARITAGFRHQVRAHLAALGLPILGDSLYGEGGTPGAPASLPPPVERLFLHAASLALSHPHDGRPLSIRSPLPEEFRLLVPAAAPW